jgi:hypothetical protein
MKNIFANTRPIEFVPMHTDLRNWRFLGMEMEALGTRLDAARAALASAKTDWARWYWTETVDRLMLQWRSMPAMHDGDATMTIMPRWIADYEWWERGQEIGYSGLEGLTDALFEKVFRTEDLDSVWRRHRDARLMKCNCQ